MTTGTGITRYARVYPVDPSGQVGIVSLEGTATAIAGSTTGSCPWTWTAVNGAKGYILVTGLATGSESQIFGLPTIASDGSITFPITTNSYTQTTDTSPTRDSYLSIPNNNMLFDEISLPVTTATATASVANFDVVLNLALPPGYRLIGGLGTTVAGG